MPFTMPSQSNTSAPSAAHRPDRSEVQWRIDDVPVPYPDALAEMERLVAAIHAGSAAECIWLLQHPPLYTAGTSANSRDLVQPNRFPVFTAGRGGQYTYHGPGQRIAYVMLDLRRRRSDVRRFVYDLEAWLIATLADFNVRAERRAGRVGVWVVRPDKPPYPDGSPREEKIGAIGIRIRHWVSFHGVSLNVDPDLSHYAGIVPCGIADHGVTSLLDLGIAVSMHDVDAALHRNFERVFCSKPVSSHRL